MSILNRLLLRAGVASATVSPLRPKGFATPSPLD